MFIDVKKAYGYFNSNFIIKKTSQNWYAFDNPFDPDGEGKKKMAVKFGWDRVKCWRTGWNGSIIDFIMEYEGLKYYDAKMLLRGHKPASIDLYAIESIDTKQVISSVYMPKGYTPILEGKGILCTRAQKYLLGRGFDLELMDKMGIGYCNKHDENSDEDYFGYIIVPFKRMGRLQYYIGRDFIGNFLRYKNPKKNKFGVGKADILFNEDALDLYKVNYVLEGWTDAVTIGEEAVATLGWSVSPKQKSKLIESECDELVFIPDVGKYKEAVTLAMTFLDYKDSVKVVNLDLLAEYGGDANKIGRERTMNLYANTRPLTVGKATEILIG